MKTKSMFVYRESTKSAGETAWKLIRKQREMVFFQFLFFLQSNLAASKKQSKAKDERPSFLKPKMKNTKNIND